jgi:hypothetical protein
MASPSGTTVTIDGNKFDAHSVNFGVSTSHEGDGMPMMGTLNCAIEFHIDINDNVNMPFTTLKALFDMANIVTRDKIKDIKIEFWRDESHQDAVCVYSFRGWIHNFNISSSGDANHTLSLSVEPALGKQQFHEFSMTN